ncbi:MAG: alpha/beta hydrolase-fold protein [Gemmatales bacterium]|nr:alpha/beta hydrolase-fold protein [Gemmatales bacterium]MDW8386043.1 alpha/beta hydrolase-fold protein [Gemmatales bacterium]
MRRIYHKTHSNHLGRDMELLEFGQTGARVIVFPTSKGRFFDWEDRGMIGVLGHSIDAGDLHVFCVDSVDAESWYAEHKHPADRVKRHMQYDAYLLQEVLPFTMRDNANPFLIVTGASFGGYHAVNFGLRHPEKVGRILSMSGLCDIRQFTDGYYDENIYFNNPVDFIVHEHDPARLEALRRIDIILAVGRDDPLCASNQRLSGVLWEKGIGNALRIWDGWAHDWPYWEKMLRLYISGHD